jgi:hypothetical protein
MVVKPYTAVCPANFLAVDNRFKYLTAGCHPEPVEGKSD